MHAYYLRAVLNLIKRKLKITSILKQFELHERFLFWFLMNMSENKGIFTCILKKRLFNSSNLCMCEIHTSTWLLPFSLAKGGDTLFSSLKMVFYYRCKSMISGSCLFFHTQKPHICRASQPLLHPKKSLHGIIFISIDSFV